MVNDILVTNVTIQAIVHNWDDGTPKLTLFFNHID
jgi:hypothetical protein